MNAFTTYLHNFAFNVYPYICLAVFFMGSLARFDRDQYTWKSDSSQMLRAGQLRWGSNLFHIGILFLFFGHEVGLLTPHWVYEPFISAPTKQMFAIVSGGIAGLVCFIGLTLLLHRRIFDPRIRLTSHRTDLAILVILWVQLVLGLTAALSYPRPRQRDAGAVRLGDASSPCARRRRLAEPGPALLGTWYWHDHLPVVPVLAPVHVERFRHCIYLLRLYQVVRSRPSDAYPTGAWRPTRTQRLAADTAAAPRTPAPRRRSAPDPSATASAGWPANAWGRRLRERAHTELRCQAAVARPPARAG